MQVELTVEQRQAQAEQRAAMRRDALQREINRYVGRGYVVISQTDYTAQLLKRKRFGLLWPLLWTCLFGIGLLVYIVWYWSRSDRSVYLMVDESSKVKKR